MIKAVAVIGVGLIGGSIAGALRAAGTRVTGFDSDSDRVDLGLSRGLLDHGSDSLPQAMKDADVVILATPIYSTLDLLSEVDRLSRPEALLLDTGSAKRQIVSAMAQLEGAGRAVGGHPLAGSERSGPEAAHPDLFTDKQFVLCPSSETQSSTILRAQELVSSIGARQTLMNPSKHDEVLARTSHLPQVIASTLIRCLEVGDRPFVGDGLRDMARLAGSDPSMWRDIFIANKSEISSALQRFSSRIEEVAGLIKRSESNDLHDWMETSRNLWLDLVQPDSMAELDSISLPFNQASST